MNRRVHKVHKVHKVRKVHGPPQGTLFATALLSVDSSEGHHDLIDLMDFTDLIDFLNF